MAALAGVDDIEYLWRELTSPELITAGVLLDRVSALIRSRIPGIDARIAADPNLGVLAAGVVADAVLRVMRNPEGYVSEQIGAYSYSRASTVGGLSLTDAEWALLLPTTAARGAFTITPCPRP
jgi:hypothetical protein